MNETYPHTHTLHSRLFLSLVEEAFEIYALGDFGYSDKYKNTSLYAGVFCSVVLAKKKEASSLHIIERESCHLSMGRFEQVQHTSARTCTCTCTDTLTATHVGTHVVGRMGMPETLKPIRALALLSRARERTSHS